MKLSVTKRPSPAIIVAVAALAFAMVGTAVAGTDGLSSKITKSKVKSISTKQANKQIDAKAPGLSVAHADTADTANNAANAGAVGGQTVSKVFTKIPSGTGATNVFSGNGLTITVACPAGDLAINATTSVNDSYIGSNLNDATTAHGNRSSNFDVGDNFNPLGAASVRGEGTITYSQSNGAYVNLVIGADDANTFGTFAGCVVVGTATSG